MHRFDTLFIRRFALCTSLAVGGLGGPRAWGEEPPLDKLVELNAAELFGAEAAVKDGRVTLRFGQKGAFARAFRVAGGGGGRGFISNIDDLKEVTMRGNVAGGLEGNFSFAGLDAGEALSRFEMADELSISFRMRAPVIAPGASFLIRLNQSDARNHIQTSFFQDIVVTENGKPRRKAAEDARFTGAPAKWFHQKHAEPPATQVAMALKDKKLSITLTVFDEPKKSSPVVVVAQEAIEKPNAGKISLKFSRLNFGMADFVIEGKYSRSWAEAEVARLRREKKLRLSAEDPEPGEQNARVARGKRGNDDKKPPPAAAKAKRGKREPPDVGTPDPDAEIDL